MKNILVPCDFSKPAINAFRFALDVASKSHGTVHVVNVIELPVLHDSILMPVLSFEQEMLKDLREKVEGEFKKLDEKYGKEGVKLIFHVRHGSMSKMLLDYAMQHAIELIVMGSHGASGVREFLIGSNAEKIVRSAVIPVVVLKEHFKGHIKNIIFPNTLETENQEDLVMKVKSVQHFFGATLHIVWINTPTNFASDTVTNERLQKFAKRFMLKDYTTNVFNHHNEEEGVIKFTQMIKGDMIAMGTHGRKGISHFLLGSMAEDIVNQTDRIIWTYTMTNEPVEA
jgi:nucleotide-binding universal stress UspA family protein